jgi:hypothetical protein
MDKNIRINSCSLLAPAATIMSDQFLQRRKYSRGLFGRPRQVSKSSTPFVSFPQKLLTGEKEERKERLGLDSSCILVFFLFKSPNELDQFGPNSCGELSTKNKHRSGAGPILPIGVFLIRRLQQMSIRFLCANGKPLAGQKASV